MEDSEKSKKGTMEKGGMKKGNKKKFRPLTYDEIMGGVPDIVATPGRQAGIDARTSVPVFDQPAQERAVRQNHALPARHAHHFKGREVNEPSVFRQHNHQNTNESKFEFNPRAPTFVSASQSLESATSKISSPAKETSASSVSNLPTPAKRCEFSGHKIWISEKTRYRRRFRAARAQAASIGLDESPFFPADVAGFVGIMADHKAAEAKALAKKVKAREAEVLAKKETAQKPARLEPSLANRADGLSTVLALPLPSMWTQSAGTTSGWPKGADQLWLQEQMRAAGRPKPKRSSASQDEAEEIALWEAPEMVFDLIGEIDRQLNTQIALFSN